RVVDGRGSAGRRRVARGRIHLDRRGDGDPLLPQPRGAGLPRRRAASSARRTLAGHRRPGRPGAVRGWQPAARLPGTGGHPSHARAGGQPRLHAAARGGRAVPADDRRVRGGGGRRPRGRRVRGGAHRHRARPNGARDRGVGRVEEGSGMSGMFYEDFEVGMVIRHAATRTVTETDNLLITSLTMNVQPLHLDEEFGRASIFGSRIVNSIFTLGLVTGIPVAETTLGTTL